MVADLAKLIFVALGFGEVVHSYCLNCHLVFFVCLLLFCLFVFTLLSDDLLQVPQRIFETNNATKLVLIVRNPVDRLVSDYNQFRSRKLNRFFSSPRQPPLQKNPTDKTFGSFLFSKLDSDIVHALWMSQVLEITNWRFSRRDILALH